MAHSEADVEYGSAIKLFTTSKPAVENPKLNMYTNRTKQIKLSNHLRKNTDQVLNKLLEVGTLYGESF